MILLWIAISQGYDLVLIFLYLHITTMYIGACIAHATLIAPIFTFTVSAVIANSLQAFFWWSFLLGGFFEKYATLISWIGLIVGLIVGIGGILILQSLESFEPIGGFITLSIVQPPFVFLGLVSSAYLYLRHPYDPGYRFLFIGGSLLMTAMGLSAIETYWNPIILESVGGGFPLVHVLIHIIEQVGIYFYGTGAAWIHLKYVVKRQDIYIQNDFLFSVRLDRSNPTTESTILNPKDFHFDLLSPEFRMFPEVINSHLSANYMNRLCPVLGESHCYAVCNPTEIRNILKTPQHFSSNPFPDDRLIGLSTTNGSRHDIQLKIIGKYFSQKALQILENDSKVFSRIADYYTQQLINRGGGDLVNEWGYRIAVASGLVALGVPVDDILENENLFQDHHFIRQYDGHFIDIMAGWSREVVKLMAPIGGMGPRYGVTLPQLLKFFWNLLMAIPGTLSLIRTIGIRQSWLILRPDLILKGHLFPYFQTTQPCPRTGILLYSSSLPQIPEYICTLRRIWIYYANKYPHSPFHALLDAKHKGILTESEALLLIIQCLVSMTTANALVNAVVNLFHPEAHTCTRPDINWSQKFSFDDQSEIISSYIDYCLTYFPPLQRLPRRVVTTMAKVHDLPVDHGDQLILMLGAANTKLETNETSLTFGAGVHKCLGEDLVRFEMKFAITAWLNLVGSSTIRTGRIERIQAVDVGNYGFEKFEICLK